MKIKRTFKTNVILSFVTTLLILSIIDLSFVPQTNSKFKTAGGPGEDGIALEYQVGLYPLYREGLTYKDDKIPKLTPDTEKLTFDIEFSFPRQALEVTSDVTEENQDNYTFNTPIGQGCTVTKVNGENRNTVSFVTPTEENEVITVNLHCTDSVKPVNGMINLSVGVRERVGNEADFAYTDYSFVITEEYYNTFMEIIKWENPLVQEHGVDYSNDTELYTNFTEWLDYYAKKTGYESIVNDYLYNASINGCPGLKDAASIKYGSSCWNKIPGLKMEYDDMWDIYTYTIEENLLGYARTYEDFNYQNMYFYVSEGYTEKEIDAIFEYYLKNATTIVDGEVNSVFSDEDISDIKEYLSNRGGISGVMRGKYILGISYARDDHRISLGKDFLSYVKSLKNYPDGITVKFDRRTIMTVDFLDQLAPTYGDKLSAGLSESDDASKNRIYTEIGAENLFKNATNISDTPISFIDYYAVWDGEDENHKNYVIVKAFSDIEKYSGDEMYQYNHYTISPLVVPPTDPNKTENVEDFMNVRFVNDPTDKDKLTITITVKDRNEEEARSEIFDNILVTLVKYFDENGAKVDVENYKFAERNGTWAATFTVSKGYEAYATPVLGDEEQPEDGPLMDPSAPSAVLGTQTVQDSINKVTGVVDSTAEGVYGNDNDEDNNLMESENEVEEGEKNSEEEIVVPPTLLETDENSGFTMISSIMKFILKK